MGDPVTGVAVYSRMNGGWNQIGGTSVSSPIWAGYLTIINAAFQYAGIGNLGWLNPVLYFVGCPYEDLPSKFLYGVWDGSNGDANEYPGYPGYINGQGYSNTTGIVQIFLTKDTTATATQLIPNKKYRAFLWAFNSSGGSMSNELYFSTLKKP